MKLVPKFFAGFHHFILCGDDMSIREFEERLDEIKNDGYVINHEKATRWVSFKCEVEAVEFKLRYSS